MKTIDYAGSAFQRDPLCVGCDADGFRRVAPGYVREIAPFDLDGEYEALTQLAAAVEASAADAYGFEQKQLAYREHSYNVAVAADCVYPCPTCKPEQYRKWRNGCFEMGHARSSCEICGPKDKRK